uniref:Uncharacterized protein n=1 Tax=Salmonella phage pJS4 TaxID=3141578 RepID=A0AAU7E3P4_9VIRU
MNVKGGAVAPPDYTLPLRAYASNQERNRNVFTLYDAIPVGGICQVLPGSGACDGFGAVTGDYRAGEAVTQRMEQPGFTGPQGLNATAVTAGCFTLILQRVGRGAFAIADCAVTEDDADKLTVGTGAHNGHAVIDNHTVALIGGEHGVVVSVTDEVNEVSFARLAVYEAVHRNSTQHFTSRTHQRVAHGLGGVDKGTCIEAQGGGHINNHIILGMVFVGRSDVIVVQAESGCNQTTLRLALPEVIQAISYGLQRVLAGQFNGQVGLSEAFVQVRYARHHLASLHVTRGSDVLVHVVRVVRLDRSVDGFPERDVSQVGRAASNFGSIRSRGKNAGFKESCFLYRVLCHIGQQDGFVTGYDIANSGNSHYYFLRASSCRLNSAGLVRCNSRRSASVISLNIFAAPPPLPPEAPPPEAALALIKWLNALCSRRYLRNCSGSVVITLPSGPTNLVTTSSPSNSVRTNGARMSTASGVIKSPAKLPRTALRSLPSTRLASTEYFSSFSFSTGSYWLRIVFSNSSILPADFSASWCASWRASSASFALRAASFFSVNNASLLAFKPATSFSTASAIICCTCSAVKVVAPPAGLASSPASFMSGKRKKRFIVSMSPGR